jgi:hypothetical protein
VVPHAARIEEENEHKSEAQRSPRAEFARVGELELACGTDKEGDDGGCEEEG